MLIFQVNASYKPAYIYGGPTRSVSKLCEELITLLPPNALEVLTTTANGDRELNVNPGEKVTVENVPVTYFKRLTKDHTHFSPSLLRALQKKIRKDFPPGVKPIVHIHAWWNLVSMLSCYIARKNNVPVVLSPRGMLTAYTLHNRNSWYKKLLHNLLGKDLLNYCHFHATTTKEAEDILSIIQPRSITVIPNLVDFPSAGELPLITVPLTQHEPFKLLFLSRIEEKKGLELLFKALSFLKINYLLTIAGAGSEVYIRSLKTLAGDLGITAGIVWAGEVYQKEKFDLLAKSDMLCLTSYNENFANVVIEALSQGTPVMVSEEVGLAGFVNELELGWVCTLNPGEIASTIENAFHNFLQRAKIREKAPGLIRENYKTEILAGKYLALYNNILGV